MTSKLDKLNSLAGGSMLENLGLRTSEPASSFDDPFDDDFDDLPRDQHDLRKKHRGAAKISVDEITSNPQVRKEFDQEALEQLSRSLQDKGQLQPIRVRWDEAADDGRGQFVIIMGERRWRAAQLAGMETLDCIVHESDPNAGELLELQLIENLQREDLNPIEEANAYHNLMQHKGCDGKTLAAELHVHPTTVTRTVKLLQLPDDIQDQLIDGSLPQGIAREVVKLSDPDSQREMVARFHEEGLTAKETADAVKATKTGKASAAGKGTKKSFKHGKLKIQVSSSSRMTQAQIAEGLRAWASELEKDGRTKPASKSAKRKAA